MFRREEAVFRSMLGSWSQQQLARGLSPETTRGRDGIVRRFCDFTGRYPWSWQASDLDAFSSHLRSAGRGRSTLRQYHNSIRVFCDYLISNDYDWVELCEAEFGDVPSQICLPWNTTKHVAEYEGRPSNRAMTYDEMETFFACADARVDELARARKKGALAALRDAQMFKTAYAFGLRRAELRGLDEQDLHFNTRAPQWGRYAALFVRHAKAVRGGNPRRRTVLLVPQMKWWVECMEQWMEEGRPLFGQPDLAALWPTERGTRVSLPYMDRRFAALRSEAGLDPSLKLHCLRHSYVTHLIEHGYQDRFVQEQVGHLVASSTALYTSVSGDFKNGILAERIRLDELEALP
ncbi:tyrosine-type recombinase/integrase [Microbacterium sp. PAMC22086]|nr:tyrosine-type recombinase/integrase [Microbacterium sp. PAMC22086]